MTRAVLRHHQASPSKVRQVLNLVRGLDVAEAREILRFSQRGPAVEVAKLLDSAVANAEHNDHIASDELFISEAWADEGPTMKRFRPRARGRGTKILKRTSHITVVVSRYSDDELRARAEREAASGTGAAAERRRRLSRGRRVAASTAAQADHDHEHEHGETPAEPEALVEDSTDASGPDAASAEDEGATEDAPAGADTDEESGETSEGEN